MKPNWQDAPTWANYLAMDADGHWNWYENEPVWSPSGQAWYPRCGSRVANAGMQHASNTLERRL